MDVVVLDEVRPEIATGIYGLRTEMEGLQEFMSMGSEETGFDTGASGERRSGHDVITPLEITVREFPHMVVRTKRGCRKGAQGVDSAADSVLLETLGPKRTLANYLDAHRSIEALLAVVFWSETHVSSQQVMLSEETDSGYEPSLRSHGLPASRETRQAWVETRQHSPLFRYTDGSAQMFDIWSTIWDEKRRAIRPITNLPGIHGALPQTRLLVAGTGLEALGYYLALDETQSKHSAKDEPLAVKLDRVVESLPNAMRGLLGEEPAKRFRDAYMAVKHADCAMPPSREIHDAYAWGVVLFRLWTASQLGVPASACVQNALAFP